MKVGLWLGAILVVLGALAPLALSSEQAADRAACARVGSGFCFDLSGLDAAVTAVAFIAVGIAFAIGSFVWPRWRHRVAERSRARGGLAGGVAMCALAAFVLVLMLLHPSSYCSGSRCTIVFGPLEALDLMGVLAFLAAGGIYAWTGASAIKRR